MVITLFYRNHFHYRQYKEIENFYSSFDCDTNLYWDSVYNILTKQELLCPATFVYMPFSIDEIKISEQISTGYAAHYDVYQSILNGVFEVIERDSFMIMWMWKLDLPKIAITGSLKQRIDEIIPKHFELHLLDMTTDINIPSIVGILIGSHDFGEFIAFAAATRMTYAEAIDKTIIELSQSIPYHRYLLQENDNKSYDSFYDIKSFEDHSVFYTKHQEYSFLFDNWRNTPQTKVVDYDEKCSLSSLEKLNKILKVFLDLKIDVFVKELTTCDIKETNVKVTRVIIPALIPLNGTYGKYYLGGERLYSVPEKLGYGMKCYEDLNTYPHPFP